MAVDSGDVHEVLAKVLVVVVMAQELAMGRDVVVLSPLLAVHETFVRCWWQ